MNARLYRSRTDRMIGGVCGGLGQYLGVDPVIVRLFFVLLALGGSGIGGLAYLLLWIIVPYEDQGEMTTSDAIRSGADEMAERARTLGSDLRSAARTRNPQAGLIIGAALVILGVMFLLQNMLEMLDIFWLRWLNFATLWPLLLVAGGVVLLWRIAKGE